MISRVHAKALQIIVLVFLLCAVIPPAHAQVYDLDIYVDPGHGGSSAPGYVTHIPGYPESFVNLDVADSVRAMLDSWGSMFRYHFSRTSDVFVRNTARAYEANDLNAYSFVSIHHNSGGESTQQGTETWKLNISVLVG